MINIAHSIGWGIVGSLLAAILIVPAMMAGATFRVAIMVFGYVVALAAFVVVVICLAIYLISL